MNSDPPSRRFDPSRLFPGIGTDGAELFGPPDAPVSTNDVSDRDIDEALEQIESQGWRVCPLCGAIVARDGSVPG
jgi:hypothetical protein